MIFGKVRQLVRLISTHGYYSCRTEASEVDTSVMFAAEIRTGSLSRVCLLLFLTGLDFGPR